MELNFPCQSCNCGMTVPLPEGPEKTVCPSCNREHPLSVDKSLKEKGMVKRCVVCGKEHFYIQKDFNRNLGLLMIIGTAALSLLAMLVNWWLPYVVLGSLSFIDIAIYRWLPEITVCYVCRAIYRGTEPNPDHGSFELHFAEVYERRPADEKG